jgi:bleomycin hydrolase
VKIRDIISTLVVLLVTAISVTIVAAPKEDGGLTADLINQLRSNYKRDAKDLAIYNALTANDINALALNRDKLIAHNTMFSKELKVGDIMNQQSTGRCWMFAGLNILRPTVVNKFSIATFKLSPNYLFFWDKLEKSNVFLEKMIELADRDVDDRELVTLLQQPCADGGWWSYVVALIEKYGVIPEEIMPETYASANSGNLNSILYRKLRQDASALRRMFQGGSSARQLRAEKERMLAEVYKIVAMNFGEPPQKFVWRYVDKDSIPSPTKEYTPVQFYKDVIGLPLSNWVSIFNYPGKDYFKLYRIEDSRNLYDKEDLTFINLPIDSLKRYALSTILADEPVEFSCDVGKSQYGGNGKGIMAEGIYDFNSIYGMNFVLTKEERIKYRESSPNHAMVITGVDTANGKATKWKVENSWGTARGDNGWWTMYDDWFNEYVYIVITDKKYLPKEVLSILDTKPTILPPWDPMWEYTRGVTETR